LETFKRGGIGKLPGARIRVIGLDCTPKVGGASTIRIREPKGWKPGGILRDRAEKANQTAKVKGQKGKRAQ